MRILLILVAVMLAACDTPGRWIKAGGTDLESQADYAHCEHIAMLDSEGMRSVEPFKEEIVKQNCMKKMGYAYLRDTPPK